MYPNQNPADAYKRQGVLTATPAELIVMLYDGCIRQLKLGALAAEKKDFERANACFQKAQRIIAELAASLDMRYDISKNLMELYEYMAAEIVLVNQTKDAARLEGVLSLLSELKAAWTQVAKNGAGAIAAAEALS
ncbi:MAG: flagellar export chaperone FliS [Clostridiaceae bacterium]|nr:flagellar export chaperone FliS [Eubacteriales bacterium]